MSNLPDPTDQAAAFEQQRTDYLVKHYRKPEGPAETGFCLNPNCGLEIESGRRWCDAECRDEWEKRNG